MKQLKYIFLWIVCWAISASVAQGQSPDSTVVHGLRELGSRSMTTGVQSTNHSGIPVSNVAELNTAADDLKAVITAAGVTDFKVYDYASYPFLTFLGKEADGDAMMKAMEEKIAAITPAVTNYLLIGKIIDEQAEVKFFVKLKLSSNSNFTENKIKIYVNDMLNAINIKNQSLNGTEKAKSSEQEIEGLKNLANKLTEVSSGFDLHLRNEDDDPKGGSRSVSGIGLTPSGKVIIKEQLNKVIIDNIEYKVSYWIDSGTPYVVSAVELIWTNSSNKKIVDKYIWNGQNYKKGTTNLTIIRLSDTANEVEVDECIDNCVYRKKYISWSNGDLIAGIKARVENINSGSWIIQKYVNANKACNENYIRESLDALQKYCTNATPTLVTAQTIKLRTFSRENGKRVAELVETVNSSCKGALVNLTFDEIADLISQVNYQSIGVGNEDEFSILHLMAAIKTTDYTKFYEFLETKVNGEIILESLLMHMDDFSFDVWQDGNNYSNFTNALIKMYSIKPYAAKWSSNATQNKIYPINAEYIEVNLLSKTNKWPYGVLRKYYGAFDDIHNFVIFETLITKYAELPAVSSDTRYAVISPLSPVLVLSSANENLDIVNTTLEGAKETGKGIILPAFFLKYYEDKERKDRLQRVGLIALDLLTIYGSGGMAVAADVTFWRRLYCMAETGGALGNIGINSGMVKNNNYKDVIDKWNLVMAGIGIKNAITSTTRHSAKLNTYYDNITDEAKAILAGNKAIDPQVVANAVRLKLDFIRLKKLNGVAAETRKVLDQQEAAIDLLLAATKGGGKLGRFLKYEQLAGKLADLPDVQVTKFLDDFGDASDDVLRALNGEDDLVDVWKEVKHLNNARKEINFLKSLRAINLKRHHILGEVTVETKSYGYKFNLGGYHTKIHTEADIIPSVYGNVGVPNPTNPSLPTVVSIGSASNPITKGKYRISDVRDFTGSNKPYTAQIDVEIPPSSGYFFPKKGVDGKNKDIVTNDFISGRSSMFPDDWDIDKISEEIAYARSKTNSSSLQDPNDKTYQFLNSEGTFKIKMYIDDPGDYSSRIGSAFPFVQ